MFETILIFREMNDLLEMLQKTKNCVFCCQFFCLSGAESNVAPNLLPFQKTIWNFDNKFVRTCDQSIFNRFKSQRRKGFFASEYQLKSSNFLNSKTTSAEFTTWMSEICVVWLNLCFKYEWCNRWSQNTKTSFRNAQDKFIEQLQNYFMTRVS